MPPSSDALLTSTSRPPSCRAASIRLARTDASVMSPATGTTAGAMPRQFVVPRQRGRRDRGRRSRGCIHASPARGQSPAPSPRLAPVTIATRVDSVICVTSQCSDEHDSSVELQVHLKSSGNMAQTERPWVTC